MLLEGSCKLFVAVCILLPFLIWAKYSLGVAMMKEPWEEKDLRINLYSWLTHSIFLSQMSQLEIATPLLIIRT